MERLVLIDGHAILHRAYHAYPALTTTKGELINAVYGFTSILLNILRQLDPKYVICAFDLAKPTFRHQQFKAYKAHRPKIDEELKEQIPKAKGVVRALNIPIFEKEGFEADDVIGTIAKKNKCEVIIATGDKDALQLIDNKIKVFMPPRSKQPAQMFDRKAFIKKYGFEPRQLIDFKALAGDASDGIPGVKGIGPKSATELIVQFGSLQGIYDNLDKIKEQWRLKLKMDKEMAFMSLHLAEIVTNVPIKFNLSKCKLLDYDYDKVVKLFEVLEFRSLINRLPGMGKKAKVKEKDKKEDKQMGLF